MGTKSAAPWRVVIFRLTFGEVSLQDHFMSTAAIFSTMVRWCSTSQFVWIALLGFPFLREALPTRTFFNPLIRCPCVSNAGTNYRGMVLTLATMPDNR